MDHRASGYRSASRSSGGREWLHGIGGAVLGAAGLVAIRQAYDMHLVEKVLTRLAMPGGLVWVGLFLASYAAFLQRMQKLAFGLLVLWLGYWAVGSTWGSQQLVAYLEGSYAPIDLETVEPLDAVIVLGGGTSANPDGDVWLGHAGDRVFLGGSLYLAKKTPLLVTTGTHYTWAKPGEQEIASGTAELWQRMGVPADAIVQLSGRNTSEEMKSIKEWAADKQLSRVGIVTSAFHLRRALRLARTEQLELVPLPADFRLRVPEPLPLAVIPHGLALMDSETILKELLAEWFHR